LADLEKLNPGLSKVLPSLAKLFPAATVSAKFATLYDAKVEAVKGGYLMPTHSYFDTPTAVTFTAPETGRKVFLFQSDLDVDTDGSDPVRMAKLKDYDDARVSRSYQPLLAYSWAKGDSETAVSPFIGYYADTLSKLRGIKQTVDAAAKQDLNPLWPELQESLAGYITAMSRKANYYAQDLRWRRSLIASQDPFIVIPQTWVSEASVGDYVAVIHAGKVYPCLIGDTGPTTKAGEGSQKLARAINPKSSGRVSAVTTPAVTYVVFPGTKGTPGVPDFAQYEAKVSQLLKDIGGLGEGVTLHQWK
jgi:hypothetical protein